MADSTTITDNAGITEYHGWSTALEGRIYPLSGYMAADGTKVPASSPYDNGQFYWRADAEIGTGEEETVAGLVTLADFEDVKPTLTSTDNPRARLGLFLFDVATNRLVSPVTGLESFSLGDDATQDWEEIRAADVGTIPAATPADRTIAGNLIVEGLITGDFAVMPDAPGYKVNGVQVVGAQGANIPDPDGTLTGLNGVVTQILAHFRNWGAISNLYDSTLNDGLISLWQFNNVNDTAGSNHLTNTGGVTFDSEGANFSGSNQLTIANNASLDIPTYQSFTGVVRCKLNSKTNSQALISKTDGGTANEFLLAYVSADDGFDRFRFSVYVGGTVQVGLSASALGSPAVDTDYLIVFWYDSWAHTINIQINNGTVNSTAATLTAHPYTAQLAFGSMSIPTPSLRLDGSERLAGLWGRVLTAEERTELYENRDALTYPLQDETTARLEHVIEPYDLFDNRATPYAGAEPGGYFYSSPYSRAVFTTSATSMDVEEYTNLNESPAGGRTINVRVNGEDYAAVLAPDSAGAVTTHTVSLPVGAKTVEVWSGFQTLHSGNVVGTWLRRITFNAPATRRAPANGAPHMVVYGDSIACGAGATTPPRQGWTMLLRNIYPGSVAIEAWGGRSLFQDAPDGTNRAILVQRIVTQNPDVIWLSIGTNDYGGVGFGEQGASSFGTAYAALLDDLHAALPDAEIYAMSPLPRTSEAANTFGNTLTQYRTQISTACSTRAWATFVDGTAVPGFSALTDLAPDGVHPNTGGHVKVDDYVEGFFGL